MPARSRKEIRDIFPTSGIDLTLEDAHFVLQSGKSIFLKITQKKR